MVNLIVTDVLTHSARGANQHFSKPSDAPNPTVSRDKKGHDFFLRPFLMRDGKKVALVDRSLCAPAFLEALLTQLRGQDKSADLKLGPEIERFLRVQFESHGIPTLTGDYQTPDGQGQCDVIVETDEVIVLFEVKKKPLTRRARAGEDARILIDLAKSLLDAQIQAGWHEVRLRRHGFLDLTSEGATVRLNRNDRHIERVAVSLLDFGSFHDRLFLKHFMEGILNVEFSSPDEQLRKDFAEINALLRQLRQQTAYLNDPPEPQPFFHCWFLSVPQILIMLDGVEGAEAFKKALWQPRHIITGTNDVYHDLAWFRRATEATTTPSASNGTLS